MFCLFKDRKEYNTYLKVTILIIMIFLFVYYLKGLYPFGENSIVYGDMAQQTAAFYYNFYDVIKGSSSIFIDMNTAMSFNVYSTMLTYFISPFTYIILLFSRENILQAINIVFLFKIIFCGISCIWMLKKLSKNISDYWIVILSLLYAFNSYNLIMYQIISWLDIVIIFPIFLVALKRLLDDKRVSLYIISLSIIICFSYQIAFMVLIFTLLISLVYSISYVNKTERASRIFILGISTIISVFITLPKTLPAVIQTFSSTRNPETITNILSSGTSYMYDKQVFLFSLAVIYPILVLLITKYKYEKRILIVGISALIFTLTPIVVDSTNKIWHMGSYSSFPLRFGFIPILICIIMVGAYLDALIFTLTPIVVDSTNKIWHMGSYSSFPLRFGFIPILICIIMVGAYLDKYSKNEKKQRYNSTKKVLIGGLVIAILLFALVLLLILKKYYGDMQSAFWSLTLYGDLKIYKILLLITLGFLLLSSILIFSYRKNLNNKLFKYIFSIIIAMSIIFYSYIYIGIEFVMDDTNYKYSKMNNIGDNIEDESFYRIKDNDLVYTGYTANMPMVSNEKNLSSYTSVTSEEHMQTMKKLGYTSNWTRTYDGGGTIFTDSLFNVKYVISTRELEEDFYTLVYSFDDILIYKNKYFIRNGIKISNIYNDFQELSDKTVFEAQNYIYNSMIGLNSSEEVIINELEFLDFENVNVIKKDGLITFEIIDENKPAYIKRKVSIENNKRVYLNMLMSTNNSENSSIFNTVNVYVNGEAFNSYIGEPSNEYPTVMNNGLLDLGTYHQEELEVSLEIKSNFCIKEISLGLLDLDKLDEYPTVMNNGLLDLGTYHQEELEVSLEIKSNFCIKEISLGLLDLDKLELLVNKYKDEEDILKTDQNKLYVSVEGSKDESLFLAIPYDLGWNAEVNGEKIVIERIFGNFISIPLKEGLNDIKLTFIPRGFKVGISISILTIFSAIIIALLNKRYNFNFRILNNIVYYIYLCIYILVIFVVYIVPIGFFIYYKLK